MQYLSKQITYLVSNRRRMQARWIQAFNPHQSPKLPTNNEIGLSWSAQTTSASSRLTPAICPSSSIPLLKFHHKTLRQPVLDWAHLSRKWEVMAEGASPQLQRKTWVSEFSTLRHSSSTDTNNRMQRPMGIPLIQKETCINSNRIKTKWGLEGIMIWGRRSGCSNRIQHQVPPQPLPISEGQGPRDSQLTRHLSWIIPRQLSTCFKIISSRITISSKMKTVFWSNSRFKTMGEKPPRIQLLCPLKPRHTYARAWIWTITTIITNADFQVAISQPTHLKSS